MSTINIGINGFGRIGKCCFMQLFTDDNVCIKAININNLEIKDLEHYLNNDSIHRKKDYIVEIVTKNLVRINKKCIFIYLAFVPTPKAYALVQRSKMKRV